MSSCLRESARSSCCAGAAAAPWCAGEGGGPGSAGAGEASCCADAGAAPASADRSGLTLAVPPPSRLSFGNRRCLNGFGSLPSTPTKPSQTPGRPSQNLTMGVRDLVSSRYSSSSTPSISTAFPYRSSGSSRMRSSAITVTRTARTGIPVTAKASAPRGAAAGLASARAPDRTTKGNADRISSPVISAMSPWSAGADLAADRACFRTALASLMPQRSDCLTADLLTTGAPAPATVSTKAERRRCPALSRCTRLSSGRATPNAAKKAAARLHATG